ncbi:MAG: hypothetical protein IJU53_07725, partial [Thermoguttaceae bacterium]|nr:hypothetical protein [Thermoguttaceae bacterium]
MNPLAVIAAHLFVLVLGPWNIQFNEETSVLTLQNTEQNVSIEGTLTFESGDQEWKIIKARDAVPQRLGLLNKNNDVMGYITFQQNGSRLEMLVSHRTRQFYEGVLKFDGKVRFRQTSFACKTQASTSERVLFLAAGDGDSLLNDTLFAPEEDLALQLRSANLTVSSEGSGIYDVKMSGRIQESAEAAFVFNIEPHDLQTRY